MIRQPLVPPLSVAEEVRSLLTVGWVAAAPVEVAPASDGLRQEIDATCQQLAESHQGKSPAQIPGVQEARTLYRAFGIDPTKHRPSSEALLRRLIKRKPFPYLLNAVDICNHSAVRSLLSIGLYDTAKIEGSVTLRRGGDGESYEGIRKGEVNLTGKPVLVDSRGPFGNPTSDSLRTSVDETTRSLWMVFFAPFGFDGERLAGYLEAAAAQMEKYLGQQVRVQTND